jgi:hypothetical protein
MSLPLPAWFWIPVKVNKRFCPDWTASSSAPVFALIAFARSPTWEALIFAAPPVDRMAFSVIDATFADSRASSMRPLTNEKPSTIPAAANNFRPRPATDPSAPPLMSSPTLRPASDPFLPMPSCSFEPKPEKFGTIDT